MVVVGPDPVDGLPRRQAVENSERGKGGSCAADAASARDFDPFPSVCAAVGLAQGVESVGAVDGDPEVGPANVPMRPRGHGAVGQEQGEVRWADGVSQAAAADSRTSGKGDQAVFVKPSVAGHRVSTPLAITDSRSSSSRLVRDSNS